MYISILIALTVVFLSYCLYAIGKLIAETREMIHQEIAVLSAQRQTLHVLIKSYQSAVDSAYNALDHVQKEEEK